MAQRRTGLDGGIVDPNSMSGDERRAVRVTAGVSQERLAHFVGVTAKTVRSWEAGGRVGIPWQAVEYATALEHLRQGDGIPQLGRRR